MSIAVLVGILFAQASEGETPAASATSARPPSDGRWTFYQTGDGRDYFLDEGGKPDAAGVVRFRIRQVPQRPEADSLPYRSVIAVFQLDCRGQTIAMETVTTYDAAGKVSRTDTIPAERLDRDRIYAGSENEGLYVRYCPAALRKPVPVAPPPPAIMAIPPPVYTPPPFAPPAPPPPPPRPAWPAVPARPVAPLATLLSADDYPAAALRLEQEGTVRYRLSINKKGAVTACTVTSSSGSSILDSVTCRLVAERARFTPARNAKGKKVSDTAVGAVRWQLPTE